MQCEVVQNGKTIDKLTCLKIDEFSVAIADTVLYGLE